jgi:histone deacetylase complex regulatory component SIN3
MDVFGEETKKIELMSEEQKKEYTLAPHKFNKLRRRQIEKVYLEIGGYMVNTVAQQPARAVPILYNRFKSIYLSLTKPRNELVREWFLSCEKAFHKSLDHRSFHFKAFEKKQQQAKAYINEIKAI